MKTIYDKLKNALDKIKEGNDFIEAGLADGSLMKLNNGIIIPRFCPFCHEIHGQDNKIQVKSLVLNDPLVDEKIKAELKNGKIDLYDSIERDIKAMLLEVGYDVDASWHQTPRVMSGTQYIVYCDVCHFTSVWHTKIEAALDEYDWIVKNQIECRLIYGE